MEKNIELKDQDTLIIRFREEGSEVIIKVKADGNLPVLYVDRVKSAHQSVAINRGLKDGHLHVTFFPVHDQG